MKVFIDGYVVLTDDLKWQFSEFDDSSLVEIADYFSEDYITPTLCVRGGVIDSFDNETTTLSTPVSSELPTAVMKRITMFVNTLSTKGVTICNGYHLMSLQDDIDYCIIKATNLSPDGVVTQSNLNEALSKFNRRGRHGWRGSKEQGLYRYKFNSDYELTIMTQHYIKEPDIRIIEPNLITLIWEQHNKRLVLNQLLSDRKTMERNHAIFSNDYYL